MSFSSLYKKKYLYKTGEIEKNLKFGSFMKKKKQKGVLGFHASSNNVYMKFHLKGRVLVLFKEEPNMTNSPTPQAMLFVKKITKIDENVDGKESHFRINVGTNFWQFKCEDKKLKVEWIKHIKFFQKLYKNDPDYIERKITDMVDLQTLNKIKSENEHKQFDSQAKKNFDYTTFIKDKGVKRIFETTPLEGLKNRLLISKTDKETVKRTDGERSEPQTPITPISPIGRKDTNRFQLSGLVSTNYHMVMISSLTSTVIDQDYLKQDFDVIKKDNLPGWMNFSIFYFFEYKNVGDDSFFKKATAVRDIEYVLFEKDGKTLKIQLPSKYFHLGFKTHWESLMWWEGYSKSINYEKMLLRTKNKEILFDIERLYEYHVQGKLKELKNFLKTLAKGLTIDMDVGTFCNNLDKITNKLNSFLDAFNARKPVDLNLYKFCAFIFNRKIREMINQIWNKNHKPISSIEISDLIAAISKYQNMLKDWDIEDPNFGKWIEALFHTFVTRHFLKSKEIIANILKNIKKNPEIVNDKLVEKSSGPLSFYINSLFNFYDKCKSIEAAEIMISECGINFFIFFTNVNSILRDNKLQLDNYLTLLNNKYIKCINKFKRKIKKDTNKAFKISKIKALLNEKDLVNIIFSIEKKCSKEIKNYFHEEIKSQIGEQNDFLDFDLAKFMNGIVTQFKTLTKMLENKTHVQNFFIEFFKEILFNYFQKFIETAPELTAATYKYTRIKVEDDVKVVNKLASEYAPDLKKRCEFYMNQLILYLNSETIDQCIVSILNIQVFYKPLITKINVKKMLCAKIFFTDNSKDYIQNYFYNALDKNSRKISQLDKLCSAIHLGVTCIKFMKKMKKVLKEKRIKRKSETIPKFIAKYHAPKLTVLQPTYEKIYNTKCWGKMLLFDKKHSHKKISKYLKDKIKTNTGWDNYYFFFNVGCLSITKDTVPRQILFNVLYKNFKEIKQLGSYCLYVKERTTGYAFYFKDKNKSLMFNNFFNILKSNSMFENSKEKLEPVRLVNSMTHLTWHQDKVVHKFDFKKFDVEIDNENPDKIEFNDDVFDGSSTDSDED